jgi:hypothetical protein
LTELVRRAEWLGAGRVPDAGFERRSELSRLVLHHTAIPDPALAGCDPAAEADYMRRIEELHRDRGWRGVGYHFVVMPSGRVYEGRPSWSIGAHASGHNGDSIGIALAGDFEEGRPEAPAVGALPALAATCEAGTPIPLVAHGDLAETACPGRHLREAVSLRPV